LVVIILISNSFLGLLVKVLIVFNFIIQSKFMVYYFYQFDPYYFYFCLFC
jgi:hypothetical protein